MLDVGETHPILIPTDPINNSINDANEISQRVCSNRTDAIHGPYMRLRNRFEILRGLTAQTLSGRSRSVPAKRLRISKGEFWSLATLVVPQKPSRASLWEGVTDVPSGSFPSTLDSPIYLGGA